GIWHAGLAAVPVNAKLHGRECAFILEHSGARACFVSAGLDGEIAPHAPNNVERLVIIGSAEYSGLLAADPLPCAQAGGAAQAWPRTSLFAAPTMVKRLVECPADCRPEHLRTIVWGGAPMYVEDTKKALERFGARFAQIYGQGESPMTISKLSRQEIADREHP